jgi:hypothetical protein
MTLKHYLTSVGGATVVAWVLLATIALSINPFAAQPIVLAVFYLALFLALAGSFAVIGFVLRLLLLGRRRLVAWQVFIAFRQALLLSALAVLFLWLRTQGRLNWLTISLSLVALTVLEFVFISLRLRRR